MVETEAVIAFCLILSLLGNVSMTQKEIEQAYHLQNNLHQVRLAREHLEKQGKEETHLSIQEEIVTSTAPYISSFFQRKIIIDTQFLANALKEEEESLVQRLRALKVAP